MMAEAEVLIIRSSKNAEELRNIDHQISEALKKVKNTEIRSILHEMWATNTKSAEEKKQSKWRQRKDWWARTVKPVSDSEGKGRKNKQRYQSYHTTHNFSHNN